VIDQMNAAADDATSAGPRRRFDACKALVEFWRGPVPPPAATPGPAPIPVPAVLRWFYEWAVDCRDVMNAGYYHFRSPDEFTADEHGIARFCVECQWVMNFAVRRADLRLDDPPVLQESDGDLDDAGLTLSEFLTQFYFDHAVASGPCRRDLQLSPDQWARFLQLAPPVPTRPPVFYGEETHHHAGPGVLATTTAKPSETGERRITAAAKAESDLDQLDRAIRGET
jgi:hypothetical protein